MWKTLRETAGGAVNFARWVLVILLGLYLASGFYAIKPDEIGVVERLGKVVNKMVAPGLHYDFPRPFARVHKVPIKKANRILIDDFYQGPNVASTASAFYALTGLDSYCLSGDNNVVEILAAVQYTIADPFDYLFVASHGEALLRDIVSREIVHALSSRPVDMILTYGKKEIEGVVRRRAQEKLDADRTGLLVSSVEINEVRPPASVQSHFDDVINAHIEKRERISRAESYRNEAVPRARAQAGRSIREAEAYRDKVKNSAMGESERFLNKLTGYVQAPGVTMQRLYLEFVRDNLAQFKIYLLDKREGESAARLRILSLE